MPDEVMSLIMDMPQLNDTSIPPAKLLLLVTRVYKDYQFSRPEVLFGDVEFINQFVEMQCFNSFVQDLVDTAKEAMFK